MNPSAGNLGGGGFMLLHLAETNETLSIDYEEPQLDLSKRCFKMKLEKL